MNRLERIAHIVDGPRRPAIVIVPGEEHRMVLQAEAALSRDPPLIFQRGARLVRPGESPMKFADGSDGFASCLHEQGVGAIQSAIAERIVFQRHDIRAKQLVERPAPKTIAWMISSRAGQWSILPLGGVISCPTLRKNGTVLHSHGYDQQTGVYSFSRLGDPCVLERPSRADAEAAFGDLLHLLEGFAFAGEVDLAVALSILITPMVRSMMTVAPLHGVTAPMPGAGKSHLIDCAGMIQTGRRCPVIHACEDPQETEKRLVAALLAGFGLISLDNVNRHLESDILCQAVERHLLALRPLGSSTMIEIENRACVFANGNSFGVGGDLSRRTLLCRLSPQEERPELRTFDFDPVTTIATDRLRYVKACLTIVKAFMVCGVQPDLPPMISFEDWTAT